MSRGKNKKQKNKNKMLAARKKRQANRTNKKKAAKEKREAKLSLPSITRKLFDPVVPENKQADNFKSLLHEGYRPALTMMEQCYTEYHDKDGNFIEQFQSSGFDARTWELYLHTYLADAGFTVSDQHESPDFVVNKGTAELCIEAVTTNRSLTGELAKIKNIKTAQEHFDFNSIKMGSSLWSKHQKGYWTLSHVKSKPLIFALECFHEDGPFYSGDAPLIDYLYGKTFSWFFDDANKLVINEHENEAHTIGEKEIPSGFFNLSDSENISAILFSNSATAAKFNRMGKLKWPRSSVKMVREGIRYRHDPNSDQPKEFKYEVGNERPKETWGEGLIMFHNPNAANPVDTSLFSDIPHGYYKNGSFTVDNMPSFHPLSSVTNIFI